MNMSNKITKPLCCCLMRTGRKFRQSLLFPDTLFLPDISHLISFGRATSCHETHNEAQKSIHKKSSHRNHQDSKPSTVKPFRKSPRVVKKSPVWLESIHTNLMKSVKLPDPLKERKAENLSERHLASLDSSKLLVTVASTESTEKRLNNIITAIWRNFTSMKVEDIITVADVLHMKGVQSPLYTRAMVTYFTENLETLHLSPLQIIRLVFHMQQSSSSTTLLLTNLERRLEHGLSDFTIDEIANICQMLFHKQYRLRSLTLVDQIACRLVKDFDSLTPHNLPMLLKAFRYSNYIKLSFYKQLGDHIISTKYLSTFFNAGQIMHLAFAFASVRITHHKLFKELLQRILELQNPPRLKDLSKIIWACGTLVTAEMEHLERIHAIVDFVRLKVTMEQVLKYPDNLMDFLVGLAYLNIYPLDLIDSMLDSEVVKVLLALDEGRAKFLQLQFLDASLAIECPNFKKKLLSESDKQVVEKNLQHFKVDVDMKLRKPLVPVLHALRDVLGTECVQCCFVLPHFKTADILLAFDIHQKKFVSTNLPIADLETGKTRRVVIMLLSKAQTSYDNQPLGMLHCKQRQLRTLGYTIIPIDADEALSYTLMHKQMIQEKILGHIYNVLDDSE